MKLKALNRAFRLKNNKRGIIEVINPAQEFEIQWPEEAEQINELIMNLRCYCIDDKFIKDNSQYKVQRDFPRIIDGEKKDIERGSVIRLGIIEAQDLMIRKIIKPNDPEAWYPGKRPDIKDVVNNTPKKMYDDEDRPKTSWIDKWRIGK